MYGDAIRALVIDVDVGGVSLADGERRPWEAAVHCQHTLRRAQPREVARPQLNIENYQTQPPKSISLQKEQIKKKKERYDGEMLTTKS